VAASNSGWRPARSRCGSTSSPTAAGSADVRFDGTHYRLAGASSGPRPNREIGIWVGAYQRRMLALTGRTADGWVPSSPGLPPAQLAAANHVIDEAAVAAGRSPRDVVRLYNIDGGFGESPAGFLHGPPRVWAEQLAELTLSEGVSAYILTRATSADLIERFAAEVAPAVREAVAAERAVSLR
jgi:alkanesulfonate monooxygenase SsuD/methylene tetrahydromethanopterin reductase-like flavin-dependent oxidoreductase (luciferase family)